MTQTHDEVQGVDRLVDRSVGPSNGSFTIFGQGIISWLTYDMGWDISTVGAANLGHAMLYLIYLVILVYHAQLDNILMFTFSLYMSCYLYLFYAKSHQNLPVFMTDQFSFASFSSGSPQVLREETLALSLDFSCFRFGSCIVLILSYAMAAFLLPLGN